MQPETNTTNVIAQELAKINTSNQWSLLPAILTKLNKRLPEPIKSEELETFLKSITEEELKANGIWVQFFGTKYMPIICINPPLGRMNNELGLNRPCKCKSKTQETKYFGSFDYNAGRHQSDISAHIPTCILWCPPKAGHLHSWRRGYSGDKKTKKEK